MGNWGPKLRNAEIILFWNPSLAVQIYVWKRESFPPPGALRNLGTDPCWTLVRFHETNAENSTYSCPRVIGVLYFIVSPVPVMKWTDRIGVNFTAIFYRNITTDHSPVSPAQQRSHLNKIQSKFYMQIFRA